MKLNKQKQKGKPVRLLSASASSVIYIHEDSDAKRKLEVFRNTISKLMSNLPVTRALRHRFSLKFKGDLDLNSKEMCNSIMTFTRSNLPVWWFIEPTMSSKKLMNHYLQLNLIMEPQVVSEDFYKEVFLFHCADAVDRAWSDFKKSQFTYFYDLVKNGGDYHYLSMFSMFSKKIINRTFVHTSSTSYTRNRTTPQYIGQSLEHFSLQFDPKANKNPILCTESFLSRQLMQPISEDCYAHRSLAKLDPELLENSEDAEYDERVGSLYSVAQFTEEGDIVLNQFEKRNGGWLLLFLQYMLKVVNSL